MKLTAREIFMVVLVVCVGLYFRHPRYGRGCKKNPKAWYPVRDGPSVRRGDLEGRHREDGDPRLCLPISAPRPRGRPVSPLLRVRLMRQLNAAGRTSKLLTIRPSNGWTPAWTSSGQPTARYRFFAMI